MTIPQRLARIISPYTRNLEAQLAAAHESKINAGIKLLQERRINDALNQRIEDDAALIAKLRAELEPFKAARCEALSAKLDQERAKLRALVQKPSVPPYGAAQSSGQVRATRI
jgi:hypothetical protein